MTELPKARRSWMIVAANDADAIAGAAENGPDVIVLDLEYSVPPRHKERARSALEAAAKSLETSEADVFVRIDRDTRWADAAAAIRRGVRGIVFPGPEAAIEVRELAKLVTATEKERGVDPGTTEIALVLETAKGFWNAGELAAASPRVSAVGVGRIDLTMRLGPVPQGEFRFYRFLMTRALVAARMAAKQPLGALWRPGSRGGVATAAITAKAAREGRIMGYTGCFCAAPEQVGPVNEAFATG